MAELIADENTFIGLLLQDYAEFCAVCMQTLDIFTSLFLGTCELALCV